MREHEVILEVLATRDGQKLGDLLKIHLLNKSEVVKQTVRKSETENKV
jgi:DNA-binding GntR family transcriptional regulator